MTEMPPSVPPGVHVELSRHRVLPGQEATVDAWMRMLNERRAECVSTLAPERMAVEAIFRSVDEDGTQWLYWFEIVGEGGSGLTQDAPLDRDHAAFARQAKVPGHETFRTELLLLPAPVEEVVTRWAASGS